jgi:lysophospholipase L1-like esterase
MYKILLLLLLVGCEKMSIRTIISNRTRANITNAILVCDGNSLTYGTGSTNPTTKSYPGVLDADALFTTVTVYNLGISGQTTAQMSSDAVAQVDSLFNSGVTSIVVAWEVGNDLYYNGSVNDAITRFWAYCDARKAVGFKVIIINCPPRDQGTDFGDNSAQYNAKLVSANALLADYGSHADGLIDLAQDSRFQGYNLTYYDADKVHFTDAGYQVIADLVKRKIQEL